MYLIDSFVNLPDQIKGTILSVAGVLTITSDALLLRLSSNIDDLNVQFYRYFIAGFVILITLIIIQGKTWYKKFLEIGKIGFIAGLVWGANNFLFTFAIQNGVVANVLVIVASNPMFSAVFSYILLGEVVPLRTVITCLICFAVIVIIFVGELNADSSAYVGIVAAVFCSASLGLYLVLLRLASKYEGAEPDVMACNVIACFFITIIALCSGAHPNLITSDDVLILCIQGMIEIPLSFCLLSYGPALIPATEVSLFFLIETILSPFLVWLAGFEKPPELTLYCGIALIVSLAFHSFLSIREERQKQSNLNNMDGQLVTDSDNVGKVSEGGDMDSVVEVQEISVVGVSYNKLGTCDDEGIAIELREEKCQL